MSWYYKLHGNSWEEHCHTLLNSKHGVDYQPLSHKGGGDLGLDSMVRCQGIVYQIYGLEPDNQNPIKGIKDKIHSDLKKLKTNVEEISVLLGEQKIKRWILLLNKDIFRKPLHSYVRDQENRIKSLNLPIIAPEFEIIIKDPSYLTTEHLEYEKKRDSRIEIKAPTQPITPLEELRSNPEYLKVFNKFRCVAATDIDAENLAYQEIKNYINGSIHLEIIKEEYPNFYGDIETARLNVEEDAEQGSLLSGTYETYTSTKSTLQGRLENTIGSRLAPPTLDIVKKFIISDWLIRCPLSFKETEAIQ